VRAVPVPGQPPGGGPVQPGDLARHGPPERLIFGGVFDTFPGARIILGHMGEFLPAQLPRVDLCYGYLDPRLQKQHRILLSIHSTVAENPPNALKWSFTSPCDRGS
jgi:predicted TIM-barrel fold metal-dependent hydrolase